MKILASFIVIAFSFAVVVVNLLVVQHYIRKPDQFGIHVYRLDVAIIRCIPAQQMVVPYLTKMQIKEAVTPTWS